MLHPHARTWDNENDMPTREARRGTARMRVRAGIWPGMGPGMAVCGRATKRMPAPQFAARRRRFTELTHCHHRYPARPTSTPYVEASGAGGARQGWLWDSKRGAQAFVPPPVGVKRSSRYQLCAATASDFGTHSPTSHRNPHTGMLMIVANRVVPIEGGCA